MPQDTIVIFLSDQRLQFVVADHLGQAHLIRAYVHESNLKGVDLLQGVFSEDLEIRRTYSKAYLILQSPLSLLEPLTDSEESTANLSKYMIPDAEGAIRLSDSILEMGIRIVYPFEEVAQASSQKMFPNLTIHHHHTLLIRHFASLCAHLPDDRIYARLEDDRLSIFYFKDAKLQYGNQFHALGDEDRLYYLMLIFKQFHLDASSVTLSICLGSGVNLSFISSIRSYIQHVRVLEYEFVDVASAPVFQDRVALKQFYFPLTGLSVLG